MLSKLEQLVAVCMEGNARNQSRELPYLDAGFLALGAPKRSRSRSAAEACTSLTVKSQSACSACRIFKLLTAPQNTLCLLP